MLTRKQRELYDFLKATESPSIREMAAAMGAKSTSGIHSRLVSLEEKGFIRRLPYRARAVEVVK